MKGALLCMYFYMHSLFSGETKKYELIFILAFSLSQKSVYHIAKYIFVLFEYDILILITMWAVFFNLFLCIYYFVGIIMIIAGVSPMTWAITLKPAHYLTGGALFRGWIHVCEKAPLVSQTLNSALALITANLRPPLFLNDAAADSHHWPAREIQTRMNSCWDKAGNPRATPEGPSGD